MKILPVLLTATISGTAIWATPQSKPIESKPIAEAPLHAIKLPQRWPGVLNSAGSVEPTVFAWSPDGKTLATGGENSTLYFWDVKTGKRLPGLEREFISIYDIEYSPDGRYFVMGTSKLVGVSLWNARTGKLVKTFKEAYPISKGAHIFDFTFAPDGKTLYVPFLKEMQVWDVASGKLKRKIKVPGGSCSCNVVMSHDGKRVATARSLEKNSQGETVKAETIVWNLQSGKVEANWQNIGWPLAFSRDDKRLFTRMFDKANDNRIGHWFIEKNVFLPLSKGEITANGSANPFALTPDGHRLVVGHNDGTITVRNALDGGLRQTLHAGKSMVLGLSFSPDGSLLASGGPDGQLKLWHVAR